MFLLSAWIFFSCTLSFRLEKKWHGFIGIISEKGRKMPCFKVKIDWERDVSEGLSNETKCSPVE